MKINREFLQIQGFEGYKTMGELMGSARTLIPAKMGVYVVLRESEAALQFLSEGTGGFFKGRDPNVSLADLKDNWVENGSCRQKAICKPERLMESL